MPKRTDRILINSSMLKARRLYMKMPLTQVGKAIGVNPGAISRWENGYTQPTISNLFKVAKVYKCDFKVFLTETARIIWTHLETVLLEHTLAQLEEMEDGQIPNLDMNQYAQLAERLGVFSDVDEVVDESSEAQDQIAKEIR